MKVIVGYTGFVGSNLCEQAKFDGYFNSKNIKEAYGTNPELLIYAGVRAEKHLANHFPDEDKKVIEEAIANIQKINPKQIVLISTVDVYKNPIGVDEDSVMELEGLHAYGYNRYLLEEWVKDNIENHLILRLPALFGKNIKKNFIYDYIHKIPAMLKSEKMAELCKIEPQIIKNYELKENGFYHCKNLKGKERCELRELFAKTSFNALNFTDSRAVFQFYHLSRLWDDIQRALQNRISCLNLATEPISVQEIYQYITNQSFINEISVHIPKYDFKSKHATVLGGKNGYLETKETVVQKIKEFVNDEISNL